MKRSNRLLLALTGLAFSACSQSKVESAPAPAPAPRVRSAAVGTVVGQVRVDGQLSAPVPHPLPEGLWAQCGQAVADRSVLVNAEGALANAVVFVADAPVESAPPDFSSPLIDQHRCTYEPPLVVTRAGTPLKIRNSDELMHNVRIDGAFNVAMPIEGQTISKPMPKKQGPLPVRCDVHPWMRADVYVFEHGHYAVTDAEGRFKLEAVEAGQRPITVWHARWPARTYTVTVKPNEEARLEVQEQASALLPR